MDKQKTCHGCIDRKPGCHAGCLEYLERRKAYEKAAETQRKAKTAQVRLDGYEIEGQRKRNRNMIKRRTK